MTRQPSLALLWLCAAAAGGCATSRGQVLIPPVTLEAPLPPPRVVIPQLLEPDEPAAPVTPSPAAPQPAAAKGKPSTSGSKPVEKPDPAPVTPVVPEPAAPVLQPVPNAEQLELATRNRLDAAERELNALNPRELNSEAQAHYQRAKSFIQQARAALQNRNYPFAEQLAKNAATLASFLRKLSEPTSS